jgi:antitoxin ParD1/3/4
MVRKQLYISPDQDRKLKRLSRRHGVTEAELVREAIEHLPEGEDALIEKLRAKGLLAPKPALPDYLRGKDLHRFAEELRKELGNLHGVTLSDAVQWEREHSPY